MPITFTVPATALLYETDWDVDPVVMVSCPCNGGKGYSGPLSGIPPLAAQELVNQRSNLLRQKKLTVSSPSVQEVSDPDEDN